MAAAIVLAGLAVVGVVGYHAASRDREYRRLIQQGDEALAEDQTYGAIEAFSGALALKPSSTLAHLKRGEAYRRRGDLQTALRDLRSASQLDPTATRPWEEAGDVNYALRRDARAAEAYEAYLRLDERSPRVLYKLGLTRHRQGNVTGAITALQTAVEIDPGLAEVRYLLGLCLIERNRMAEAIEALEEAVELRPALAPPREVLAGLHASEGRYEAQLQQLEALAVLEPQRGDRHISLGLAYAAAGHADLAVLSLGRAAERLPNQPAIYVALGRVWLQAAEERGDQAALRKAIEALEPIATHSAANSDALALYGRALLVAGDAERAEPLLEAAAARLPVESETLRSLALAAWQLHHLGLAEQALAQHDVLFGPGQIVAGPQ